MEKDLYPQDEPSQKRPESHSVVKYPGSIVEAEITWRNNKGEETPLQHRIIRSSTYNAVTRELIEPSDTLKSEEHEPKPGYSQAAENQHPNVYPAVESYDGGAPAMPIEHPLGPVLSTEKEPRPKTFNVLPGLDYIARKRSEHAIARNTAEEDLNDQQLDLEPSQHVERSSWHSYVVDEHGHEVKDAMDYGDSYKRERQKELLTVPAAGSSSTNDDQITANSNDQPKGNVPESNYLANELPSGMTDPALPSGLNAQLPKLGASNKRGHKNAGFDSTWFWFTAFVVVVVVAIVLLT